MMYFMKNQSFRNTQNTYNILKYIELCCDVLEIFFYYMDLENRLILNGERRQLLESILHNQSIVHCIINTYR